ncbi:MAG TPA: TonB family protein [Terriglobales bacterium]|nr:TonB family protein [Terriglobales bacterium]
MMDENSEPLVQDGSVQAAEHEYRQRRRMIFALALLLVTLAMLLVKNRDFWFPSSTTAESTDEDYGPSATGTVATPQTASPALKPAAPATKPARRAAPAPKASTPEKSENALTPVVTSRAALPPLQVEVVAGDEHRMVRPGGSSVKVELQPGTSPQPAGDALSANVASGPTTDAAERVRLSPNATLALSRPVNPSYPLLARQMKVQGSVLLQALISREGTIQDLQILNGPTILATAAREAVKQWRFKPYLQDGQPVETQAKITVNFTISTN